MRRVGLAALVDRTARRFGSRLGRFDVEVNGVRLAGDQLGHLYYARELLAEDRESFFGSLFVDAIRPGAVVLEGGPYIGYLTLLAARAVGESGSVVAVEPNPETLDTLRANVTRNGFESRVRIVQAALGDRDGRASFYMTEGGDTSSLHRPAHRVRRVEVDVLRGDALIEEVDVIKLDLEGNEVAALRGLRALVLRSRPVIFCECNPEMLAAAGASTEELLAELDELGYEVRWIDERARTLRRVGEPWEGGYANLACSPR